MSVILVLKFLDGFSDRFGRQVTLTIATVVIGIAFAIMYS